MERYEVVKSLGSGGEGQIFLVTKKENPSKTLVLKKKVKNSKFFFFLKRIIFCQSCVDIEEANAALYEALAMAKVKSEFVVNYEDVFLLTETKDGFPVYVLCIVMEYCSGGDLRAFIHDMRDKAGELVLAGEIFLKSKVLDNLFFNLIKFILTSYYKKQLREWIYQLCSAVQDIHQAKLLHRDIKSENCFITDKQTLKLGDLGEARKNSGKINETAGTYCYCSPEILKGSNYDQSTDIWSLGTISFCQRISFNFF